MFWIIDSPLPYKFMHGGCVYTCTIHYIIIVSLTDRMFVLLV